MEMEGEKKYPLVTLGLLAYNSEDYILEALDSIFNQTYPNYEIVISVDPSTDRTVGICSEYIDEHRYNPRGVEFYLYIQTERLSFSGNFNFVMDKARGDYVSIIHSDDVISKEYIENLLRVQMEDPNIVNSFYTNKVFGTFDTQITRTSVSQETLIDRITELITEPSKHNCIVAVGLINKKVIPDDLLYMPDFGKKNDMVDFGDSTLLALNHAIVGKIVCLDDMLYRRRIHSTNDHLKRFALPLDRRVEIWAKHCASLYLISADHLYSDDDKKHVYDLCLTKLKNATMQTVFIPKNAMTDERVGEMVRIFDQTITKYQNS